MPNSELPRHYLLIMVIGFVGDVWKNALGNLIDGLIELQFPGVSPDNAFDIAVETFLVFFEKRF